MRNLLTVLSISCYLFCQNAWGNEDYEQALTSFESNNIEDAYVHLKNALKHNQDSIPAKLLMGKVLMRKSLYNEGITELEEALILGADANLFAVELSNALMLTQQYDKVIAIPSQYKLNKAVYLTCLLIASNAHLALEQTQQALTLLIEAEKISADDLRVNTSMASYYLNQRKFDLAHTYIEKSIKLASNNSQPWQLQGDYYRLQGIDDKALISFEKAYQLDDSDPIVIRSLTHQYTRLSDYDKAMIYVEKILDLAPNDSFAQLLKSQLLARNNKTEQAREILEDISAKLSLVSDEQKNSNAAISYVAGTSAYMQGNLELAQKELIFYINEKPNDVAGIAMLADIYQQQQQFNKIETLLEKNEALVSKELSLALKLFDLYLKKNSTYKAKSLLDTIANTFPNNLKVIAAKASYLAKNKRFDEAIDLLAQHQPEEFSGHYWLTTGLVYLAKNDFNQAEKIADKLLSQAPNDANFLGFKGVVNLNQKKWQAAESNFKQVISVKPSDLASQFNLATSYAAQQKITEAENIVTPLLVNFPNNHNLLILAAQLHIDQQQHLQAIEKLKKAKLIDSTNIRAFELLIKVYYRQKQYDLALQQLNDLQKITFLQAKYLAQKADIYIIQEEYNEANRQLGILLGLAETAEDYFRISELQQRARNNSDAYKTIHKALKLSPDNVKYQVALVKIALAINEKSEAKSVSQKLLTRHPNNPNVLLVNGETLKSENKLSQAQSSYLKALKLDPHFNAALIRLYQLAESGIKPAKFSQITEKILAEHPNKTFMRNLLADHYLNSKQHTLAAQHYELLLNKGLNNEALILNNLANIYLKDNIEKAQSYIAKAKELDGTSPYIIDTEGWILALSGNYQKALSTLRAAFSVNSNDPTIRYHLAYTLSKLNRKSEAIIELENALALELDFNEQDDAKALLQQLKSG